MRHSGSRGSDYQNMREAVPDWAIPVAAWNSMASSLTSIDPNDVHVLAAATAGYADYIVARNDQDFPQSIVATHGIDI